MAKTRRASRKGSSSKRSKAKGGAKKRTPKRKTAKAKGVELRDVRQRLRAHVATLNAVEQPTDKVRDSLERLNRCLDEMDAICGPDMLIPIP